MAEQSVAAPAVTSVLTDDIAAQEAAEARRARNKVGLIGLLLVVAAAASIVAAVRLVEDAGERELRTWQARLGIVADSRASALAEWVANRADEIDAIANNPSVSLTLTELAMADGDRSQVADFDGQASYLRNYLASVAERAGFSLAAAAEGSVQPGGARTTGLAIVDPYGVVVSATRDMPPLEGDFADWIRTAPRDAPSFIDAYDSAQGSRIGFMAPIYRLQMPANTENYVGMVIGLHPLDEGFQALLEQPGTTEETAATLVLREADGQIELLATTIEGLAPLTVLAAADDPTMVAAEVFTNPDGFVEGLGQSGTDALASARPVAGTPWMVMYQLDRDEALAESDARLNRLLIFLLLIIALLVGIMLALWRHGASMRAARAANRYHAVADAMARQERFLRLVTDTQPSSMFVTDARGILRFANATLARRLGVSLADIVGGTISAVFGQETGRDYRRAHDDALGQNGVVALRRKVTSAGRGERVVQALHVPMKNVSPDLDGAVLTVEEDITELMDERERNSRNLHKLVDTLVTIIDARDPYAAQHSVRVGELAERVAREMAADESMISTARIAGTLLNVGKILVPSELLTSERHLGDAEMRAVRESILRGADLLDGVVFDGPVAEAVRQAQERVDGKGIPNGLQGDEILLPARVVAVANAFVAMVSSRAHRAGLDIDQAFAHIQEDVGTIFDRSVVSALVNVLDNRGGRVMVAEWVEAGDSVDMAASA